MGSKELIRIFGESQVRTLWDEEKEKYFFSVVDVVSVLTESQDPKRYWSVLKVRLKKEGAEPTTICSTFKLRAMDGKMRMTDVGDKEQIFRIIQTIPSPKAEPFKQWMAKVAGERIDETIDPEIAIQRAISTYRKHGYSDEWIKERIEQIQERKALTDEWQRVGVKEDQFGILTNDIYQAFSGMTAKEYKQFKGLKKENLRDNMTDLELVLTMLSEASTKEISKTIKPEGLEQNIQVAQMGGSVAKNARKEIEAKTGRPVITNKAIDRK